MRDQATELRNLVLRSVREASAQNAPPPRVVALAGGKQGVGVTTLAVRLSMALAELGSRVVLVDADLYRGDVAARCGLDQQPGVEEVLASRRDIHEVLVRGPAGIQVVPGVRSPGGVRTWTEAAQGRLIRQLKTLGRHADFVLLDVGGGGSGDVARRFWKAADEVLMVTTPEAASIMDSYAAIKTLSTDHGGQTRIVVNQAQTDRVAADVHRRIDVSCRRFLGFGVTLLGRTPTGDFAPGRPAAEAVDRLALSLIDAAASNGDPSRTAA